MGLKQGRTWQRRQLFTLCLTAILMIVAASCTSTLTPVPLPALRPTDTPAPTATPTSIRTREPLPMLITTPTATPAYLITTIADGQTLSLGNLELTVSRVLTSTLATPPVVEEGRQLVILDVVIQNTGNSVVSINSGRELVLKDSTNQVYKINPAAVTAVEGTTLDIDLAPGETVRGRTGFDVPAQAGELTLVFSADKFAAGRILVSLP